MSAIDRILRARGRGLVSSALLQELAREAVECAPLNPSFRSQSGWGLSFDVAGRTPPARPAEPAIPRGVLIVSKSGLARLNQWIRPLLPANAANLRPMGNTVEQVGALAPAPASAALSTRENLAGLAARTRQMRPLFNSRRPRQ